MCPARRPLGRQLADTLRTKPTTHSVLNVGLWSALAVVCLLVIAGIALGSPNAKSTSATRPDALATGFAPQDTPSGASAVGNTTGGTTAVASTSSRPTTAARSGVPAPGGVVVNAAGAVLPDPTRTPGATNPAVTQTTISSTICVAGWTATVRPPSAYTTSLKESQLHSGYAYRGDMSVSDYEEDHLISLELGGSPSSQQNLWPEPYNTAEGARVKDVVENKLHALVCSGAITLVTAQHAIATNWWTAYRTYVGTSPARTSTAPTVAPPAPPPTPAPALTVSCSASVSDASPAQYSTVDVTVHTAPDSSVTATAHYKSTDTSHSTAAASSGVADIPFAISRATIGYTVRVDVTVSRGGVSNACATAFTPR